MLKYFFGPSCEINFDSNLSSMCRSLHDVLKVNLSLTFTCLCKTKTYQDDNCSVFQGKKGRRPAKKARRKSLSFPVHHSDFLRRTLRRQTPGPEMFLSHQVMDGNQNPFLRRGHTSNLMTGNRLMTCFTHMFKFLSPRVFF